MRRRLAALLSAALVAGAMSMSAPASPASAAEVCFGVGSATVGGDGLYYPGGVFGGYRVTGFHFVLDRAGACVPSFSGASAGGTVQGYCGHSTGSGTANNTYDFVWTSAGSVLVITGELTGVAVAFPAVFAAQSCHTGALAFDVHGAVYASNACLQFGLTELLTTILAGVVSVHTNAHPCVGL